MSKRLVQVVMEGDADALQQCAQGTLEGNRCKSRAVWTCYLRVEGARGASVLVTAPTASTWHACDDHALPIAQWFLNQITAQAHASAMAQRANEALGKRLGRPA